MKFNKHCLLKKNIIGEAECIEIVAELCDLKTEVHIKVIRRNTT